MSYKQQTFNEGWHAALKAVREKLADGIVTAQHSQDMAMSQEDIAVFRCQVQVYRLVLRRMDELDTPPDVTKR